MGGGSMNAATLIKIFIKKKIIKLDKKKLQNLCDSIGQDVKLGFCKNKMYLNGNNRVKTLNRMTKYFLSNKSYNLYFLIVCLFET